MSSSAEDRYALLDRAAAMSKAWQLEDLDVLLGSLTPDDREEEPELAYLHALTLYRLGRPHESWSIIKDHEGFVAGRERLRCRYRLLKGALLVEYGDLNEARSLFADVSARASAIAEYATAAQARMNTGVVAMIRCDWQKAIAEFERAEQAYFELGRTLDAAHCTHNRGMAFREIGLHSSAVDCYDSAVSVYYSEGNLRHLASTDTERALLFLAEQDFGYARAAVERALSFARHFRNVRQEAEALRASGMVWYGTGELDAAEATYMEALRLAKDVNIAMLQAELHEAIALVKIGKKDYQVAARSVQRATELYRKLGANMRAERMQSMILQPMTGKSGSGNLS